MCEAEPSMSGRITADLAYARMLLRMRVCIPAVCQSMLHTGYPLSLLRQFEISKDSGIALDQKSIQRLRVLDRHLSSGSISYRPPRRLHGDQSCAEARWARRGRTPALEGRLMQTLSPKPYDPKKPCSPDPITLHVCSGCASMLGYEATDCTSRAVLIRSCGSCIQL